jgi:uncharacterized membrane protein (DUF106 family)
MNFFAHLIAWINVPVNASAGFLLAPVGMLPGWLSNTVISAVVGPILLIIFKYTSNQLAIGHVRDNIKADMLALKLFKDNMSVILKAQGRVLKGSLLLLFHSVRPMLVMIVPVSLLLAQMGLWYQLRPLTPGQETIISMKLSGKIDTPWPRVTLESSPAVEVMVDQVRAFSTREIYWKIKVQENGYHALVFKVDGKQIEKELAIGDGFMRISAHRPGWRFTDILLHPLEEPFDPDSVVQSIHIKYPDRIALSSGTDWWVVYFFIASLIFALVFKPFLKVRI